MHRRNYFIRAQKLGRFSRNKLLRAIIVVVSEIFAEIFHYQEN